MDILLNNTNFSTNKFIKTSFLINNSISHTIIITSLIMFILSILFLFFSLLIYFLAFIKKQILLFLHLLIVFGFVILLIKSSILLDWTHSEHIKQQSLINYRYEFLVFNKIYNIILIVSFSNFPFLYFKIFIIILYILISLIYPFYESLYLENGYSFNFAEKYYFLCSNFALILLLNIIIIGWYLKSRLQLAKTIININMVYEEYIASLLSKYKIIKIHYKSMIYFNTIIGIIFFGFMWIDSCAVFLVNYYIDYVILIIFFIVYYPRQTLKYFIGDIFEAWMREIILIDGQGIFDDNNNRNNKYFSNVYKIDKSLNENEYFEKLKRKNEGVGNYIIVENNIDKVNLNNKNVIDNKDDFDNDININDFNDLDNDDVQIIIWSGGNAQLGYIE